MNLAADLDGIFIIPDVTAHVSVQMINMGDIGPCKADWISILSENHSTSQRNYSKCFGAM